MSIEQREARQPGGVVILLTPALTAVSLPACIVPLISSSVYSFWLNERGRADRRASISTTGRKR